MHSYARSEHRHFDLNWNPAHAALVLLLTLLFLILLLLFMNIMAQPAYAQNGVPATAREAAQMPQWAAKLRPAPQNASRPQSYPPQASFRNPRDPRAQAGRGALPQDVLYDNGPINGTTDAWTINFGFVVSDSFNVSNNASISGLTFGAWLFPGDVLLTVEVSITSAEFGGTTYFDQVISFTQSGCSGNQYGFNVCTETSSNISSLNLAAGTYWVNLSNAVVNTGDPVYWDENSGPSMASENSVGTIPSEAFTVEGPSCMYNCPPECVHDKGPLKVIHSFTSAEQSPAGGLAIDQAENLYGASSGGDNGLGLAYKLALHGQDWMFTPLYSFLGGTNGQGPGPEIVGPEGALYGTADGGIQNCGNQYCGVVYRLRPSPFACQTALCSWSDVVVYQFTGDPDGWAPNGNLVFDSAGNLYGTTFYGGAYGGGAIYELTPSNNGWIENVIYSFGSGGNPVSLLLGKDGNLYGTTYRDRNRGGIIFQLVPSGDTWRETTIGGYGPCGGEWGGCIVPRITHERLGSLYFISSYDLYQCYYLCNWNTFGIIFKASLSQNGWQFETVYDICWDYNRCDIGDYGYRVFRDLAIDIAGNLYTTLGGFTGGTGDLYGGAVLKLQGDRDQYLVGFGGDDFRDLQMDASGRLYGTTGTCGNSYGTVWQLTPP